jgi:prepilin-type N-terminal cleavage/methylation domain-containing protein
MSVSNDRGFTLIEVLIAILLLSFITIGVVTITENAMNTKDRTTQLNEDNLQIETAMSRFEWDFSQIYSPLYFSTPMTFNSAVPGGAVGNPAAGVLLVPQVDLAAAQMRRPLELPEALVRTRPCSSIKKISTCAFKFLSILRA